MGLLISRFRKQPTIKERLQTLVKDIKDIEEFQLYTQKRQKNLVGRFIIFSVIIFISAAVTFYFLYLPERTVERILYIIPFVVFPFLITSLKRVISWYFSRKIKRDEVCLAKLKEEKKRLLDEVMDKETYKNAKEILEKFAPEQLQKESAVGSLSPRWSSIVLAGPSLPSGPPLPRPVLPRERTVMDRLVEFIVGDGPSNRYALVCRQCASHNGMALQEEFEYLAFRCCYCFTWNPARKQRPQAPLLPTAASSQEEEEGESSPSTASSEAGDEVATQEQPHDSEEAQSSAATDKPSEEGNRTKEKTFFSELLSALVSVEI
ncbi:hypothetical protein B566_EDAN007494 [Ephemera danica]|nr:hypothetical protein B566_EDAN007494 [Ephemera danica]